MNPLTISRDNTATLLYQPSLVSKSHLNTTPDRYKPRVSAKVLKDLSIKFATALAHEVRNPLTNINLAVSMLESSARDKGLQVYLDIIARSSVRINELINELLRYQQPDETETDRISMHQLLEEALDIAQDRITLKNIRVVKEYAKNDSKIVLDRAKIKIALTNIIINAVEAMPLKKGELNLVTISTEEKFVIQIRDNGCGISPKNLNNIFKPYFTNKPGGIGLGLAATHDILRLNHVGINVESVEDRGTCFYLLFDKNPYNPLHFG